MTALLCPVFSAAREYPQLTAFLCPDQDITYSELETRVRDACRGLVYLGLNAGTRIAVLGLDPISLVVISFAAFRLGILVFPLPQRDPQPAQFELISQAGCQLLISDQVVGLDCPVPVIRSTDVHSHGLLASVEPVVVCDQHALIIATSGSNGPRKLAVLSFGNLYYSALGMGESIPLKPGDNWMLSVPLWHVSGWGVVMRCFVAGATISVMNPNQTLLENEFRTQSTHLSLVPTQLYRLMEDPALHLVTHWPWRMIMISGAELPDALWKRAIIAGLPLHQAYGLTEMGSAVTIQTQSGQPDCGKIAPFRELKIEDGKIYVKGRTLFQGYLTENNLISLSITPD
ncbi:hypothetical protein EBR96_09025, partial [bacterium]|nr:hypothetical protein [bacterium]